MEGERPSSETAPSIWYDAVAAPQRNPGGKTTASDSAVRVDVVGVVFIP